MAPRSIRPHLGQITALLCLATGPTHAQSPTAPDIARGMAVAMGGEEALGRLGTLRLEGKGYDYFVSLAGASGTPPVLYVSFSELIDVRGARMRRSTTMQMVQRPDSLSQVQILSLTSVAFGGGDSPRPGTSTHVVEARDRLQLAPERLASTALAAPDLKRQPDTVIDGRPVRVLAWDGETTRVYVDTITSLPYAVETVRRLPDDPTWRIWGEVTTRTVYQSWALEPGGFHYPRTWIATRNGRPFRRRTIIRLTPGVPAPPDSFPRADPPITSPPPVDADAVDSGWQKLTDGVWLVPGPFNVLVIRQADGVVVVEAPHSPAYSRAVLAAIAHRLPSVPIKAVVSTSVVWSHVSGIAEYAARGIPVYTAAGNEAIVRALAEAGPGRALAPTIRSVGAPQVLGDGVNRLTIRRADVRGAEQGPHMLVVHLPDRRLLYASDLYRPARFEPNLWRQPLAELVALVERDSLSVDTVVAIHFAPTPWSQILHHLDDVR